MPRDHDDTDDLLSQMQEMIEKAAEDYLNYVRERDPTAVRTSPEYVQFCEFERRMGADVRDHCNLSLFLAEREFLKGIGAWRSD